MSWACVCERSVCVEAVSTCQEGHRAGVTFNVSCTWLDGIAGVFMIGSGETLGSLCFFMYAF